MVENVPNILQSELINKSNLKTNETFFISLSSS